MKKKKLRHGGESFTFQTKKKNRKKALRGQFEKGVQGEQKNTLKGGVERGYMAARNGPE